MIWHPSPNYGERRQGALPDTVVLHYTAMDSAERARDWLCNPESEVSAHYVIGRSGQIWHLVEEEMRAWHAGAGTWGACADINSRSLGIELDNTGSEPFSEPLMASLEALLPEIMRRWAIRPERVIGHSDHAPGRKVDPGARFDWRRLARQGMAIWPSAALQCGAEQGLDVFWPLAKRFGYCLDAGQDAVLAAFRQRFRFGAEGPLCAEDVAIIQDLAARFPVDVESHSA